MSRLLALLLLASTQALAAPSVSMTAPTSGGLYLAPATFAVKANASAPGVGIARVEFYANGTLINTDTTSPYQFDWTSVPPGTYTITAKAVDNNGAETTSAPRNVTVAATNTAPTVSLTAPADNARFLNPSSVTLSASASGPELNDLLQKVEFFANGTLVGTVTSAPYSFSWQTPALGTHSITAVATDGQGAQTTSSARTLTISNQNQPPTVSIVTPLDNSKWHSPAGFMFQASANSGEANDTVTVEFYVNGALQGSDSISPYSVNLANLAAGSYVLVARAIDGQGAQVDSATRTVTVSDTNLAPTVSISAPAAGANFATAPAGFALSANASAGEVNGWIQRVEFFINGSLVNIDTAGPWSFNVAGLANGTYTLTAKAVDQLNAETVSAPITITVGPQAKLHFIHVDHLNTPRLVSNDQQQAVWRWDQQEPFGSNPADENPSGLGGFDLPLRLPGQYSDRETNLYYNYYRDYDPSIGRFEESDPIGLGGGINTYAYVASNPTRYTDPLGLQQFPLPASQQAAAQAMACALNPDVCVPPKPSDTECFVRCSIVGVAVGLPFEAAAEQGVHRMSEVFAKATCTVALRAVFWVGAGRTLSKCYRYCYECGGQQCPVPADPYQPRLPPLPPLTPGFGWGAARR